MRQLAMALAAPAGCMQGWPTHAASGVNIPVSAHAILLGVVDLPAQHSRAVMGSV